MTTRTALSSAVLLALSTCMLAACGGGGSNRIGGFVRPESNPPSTPPPPPPQADPCQMPITADCLVDIPGDSPTPVVSMTGGRQSDYALIVRGGGILYLKSSEGDSPPTVDYRFGGGTTIDLSTLIVYPNANLISNVVVDDYGSLSVDGAMEGNLDIESSAEAYVSGTLTGNMDNHGFAKLSGKVIGDVMNDGFLMAFSPSTDNVAPASVAGNFR